MKNQDGMLALKSILASLPIHINIDYTSMFNISLSF